MSELTTSMFATLREYWKAPAENAEDQLAALKEENERLNARVAELEAKDREIFLVASSVAEDVGKGKYQIGYSAACADIVGRFYSKEPANEG